MTATRKPRINRPAAVWRVPAPGETLDQADAAAQTILDDRPDLLPSIVKIMNSDLHLDGRLIALEVFGDAVHEPTHPYRDPRAAVEYARTRQVADEATA